MIPYTQEKCEYIYRVSSLEKVVDGDTIDVTLDLGFDVCTRQRVRLLSIDTPESRTSDKEEKKFGLLSKKKLKEWCLKAVASEKDDIEIELRCPESDSRGKFGRILAEVWIFEDGVWTNVNKWLCDEGYAVPYTGQNKKDVEDLHMENRKIIIDRGELD
jgi:micrococcal nuclease|tara:strand:- start:14549 stop:15025 length:477 start_codon:yes stop_codon:yes gene_type:complete